MLPILSIIRKLFKDSPTAYSHRNRTIEIIALEKGFDIDSIKYDTRVIIDEEGSVEAISKLRRRFHVPLNVAWRFVEKLERNKG